MEDDPAEHGTIREREREKTKATTIEEGGGGGASRWRVSQLARKLRVRYTFRIPLKMLPGESFPVTVARNRSGTVVKSNVIASRVEFERVTPRRIISSSLAITGPSL